MSTGSRHAGSVVAASGPQSAGSVVVAHRLSCPKVRGIFLDQGSKSGLLNWPADSLPRVTEEARSMSFRKCPPLNESSKPRDLKEINFHLLEELPV